MHNTEVQKYISHSDTASCMYNECIIIMLNEDGIQACTAALFNYYIYKVIMMVTAITSFRISISR